VIRDGVVIARMEHVFTEAADGARDENCLIVPPPIDGSAAPKLFSEEKLQAWVKHNIEEMGTLENFLPDLYESAKQEP